MNWWFWALLVVFFAAFPSVGYADESLPQNAEAQRFEAEKHRREQEAERLEKQKQFAAKLSYVVKAKRKIDSAWQGWHPAANGKLLITRLKLTLDGSGKIVSSKILAPSGSEQEDKSVQECLDSLTFAALPAGFSTLDLYWSLISDGSMNIVECTDSPEANAYYMELLGGRLSTKGDSLNLQSESTTNAISLNNAGVMALKANDYPLAIEKFKAAIKLDPKYQLARDNIAIAHNNYGLQLRNNPRDALKQFHRARYLNPNNPTSLANIDGVIKLMGKDPHLFEDRLALGDEAKSAADYIGAIVEYSEALKISEDPKVRTKIEEATKALAELRATSGDDDKASTPSNAPKLDFAPYMADLQRRIKRAWFPPKGHESDRVVVVFKIHRDGNISDLRVDHSSGFAPSDQAAQDAVQHAALFGPLPDGSAENVDIQFFFDLNLGKNGEHGT